MKKNMAKVAVIVLALPLFAFAQSTPSVSDLQAQIASLLAQIKQLQSQLAGQTTQQPTTFCYTFNQNLKIGDSGTAVDNLVTILNKEGLLNGKTSTFNEDLASAVVGFQEKYSNEILTPNSLKNGTGFVGVATRAKLNSLYGCGADRTQVESAIINPVTPQQIQTPATSNSTLTVPANVTLCNGVYYNQCTVGNNFVCPSSGAAYCQPQQIQTPQIINQQQSYVSPQQSGATPPSDCVGKTAATANLPQDCQIYFGLLQQPVNNQTQNSTNLQLPPQAICMVYGPFAKNAPSACNMGPIPPSDCVGILPTSDSQVPSDCKTFITNQMMQGGNQQSMPPVHCMFYTPFSANTPSECKPYQGVTVPSDCVGIQPTSSSVLPADCVAFMKNQMQMNQPQSPSQNQTISTNSCGSFYWVDNTNKTCQGPKQFCGAFMYPGLMVFSTQQDCTNATVPQTCSTSSTCPTMCPICRPDLGMPCPTNAQCMQQQCVSGKCVMPQPTNPTPISTSCANGQIKCFNGPSDTVGWCQVSPCPSVSSVTNQQPPASCTGHVPTDLNLPADCAAWNAAHGMMPPPECMGKKPTDVGLPQSCINWFSMPQGNIMPMQSQPSQSPLCGGPGQVFCPSPAGTGGWCQLPPCPSTTSQSSSSQTSQTTNQTYQPNMSGSPQQNGATPPPDCVDKTATTANLPQDCQIWFGLLPQPTQSQLPPNSPTSMQSYQNNLASVIEALGGLIQEIQSFIKK